jgi:hypothetical protein
MISLNALIMNPYCLLSKILIFLESINININIDYFIRDLNDNLVKKIANADVSPIDYEPYVI